MPDFRGQILRGAKPIARYVFGNERNWRSIYGLAGELGLYDLGGRITGDTATIDACLKAKAGAPRQPRKRRRRVTE